MKRVLYLTLLCVLIIVGLLVVVSCGKSSSPTTSTQNTVNIKDFAFSPSTITVAPGTTVTWTNNDSTTHTVTSQTGIFDSGPLSVGSSFSHTFADVGDFTYHCSIHSSMVGHVIVK